jgi:hypothetical protein
MDSAQLKSIPGLIGITTEAQEDGGLKIIFELDDQKFENFFEAMGVLPGDEEGLRDVVIAGLDWALRERKQNER